MCDCGEETYAKATELLKGKRYSCGCHFKELVKVKTIPAHGSWASMKQRCLNPNATGYERYGALGIKICDRWLSFDNFYADMGDRPEGMTLDRIDNSGNYEASNCRWATKLEQNTNQRTNVRIEFDGEVKVLSQWAKEIGVTPSTVAKRIKRGANREEIFSPNPQIVRIAHTSYGETTLRQLSKLTGIPFFTISNRYQRGIRGDDLFVKRAKRRWWKKPKDE